MEIQVIFVFQIILLLTINFQFIIPCFASLSTLSISETSNQTLICSLMPSNSNDRKSVLNCTNFPIGNQIPVPSPNFSISAITAGKGFQCLLSPKSPSICILGCWRFSGTNLRYKRIYKGPMLDELDAGNSHICARVRSTNRVECWQWPDFDSGTGVNLSGITVGGEFLCGFNESKKIKCLGNDQDIIKSAPTTGDFSVIEAGNQHVCAISMDGMLNCWGKIAVEVPTGEFTKLALGNNRSCALRDNGTIVCWGENDFHMPKDLQEMEFTWIEAKNSVFCGILTQNFSVFCWGNEFFSPYSMVFSRVQAGPCTTTKCPCKILPGSGYVCNEGSICPPCSNRTSPPLPPSPSESTSSNDGKDKRRVAFLVIGCVGTFSLVILSCYFLFKFCKAKVVSRVHDSGRLDQVIVEQPPIGSIRGGEKQIRPVQASLEKRLSHLYSMGHLEEFSLGTLLKVTGNFSKENKIGHGSFGLVYRATLDDGRDIAIKRAELLMMTSSYAGTGAAGTRRQDDKDNAFISELAHLSRLNHKNLVRLLGYCDEENERVLVYEFMVHGTLHDHLHKFETAPPLNSWTARLKVALDAARGIEYLHTYAVPSIIHRDIKSSNILLDASWIAKVSDFGLSLMGPEDHESHLSLRAAGTVGYMDPEYYRLQQLTTKSDVYSFGVLLLELLSGLKAIHPNEAGVPRNVVDFAVPYIIEDEIRCLLDPKLPAPTPYEIEAVTYVGYLAADCVNLEGRNRPSMTEVVSSLEKALAASEPPHVLSPSSTTRSAST